MTPASTKPSRKANFFLVGAPKAGTTSVHRVLLNHPDIFLSPIKEPCHFCSDISEQLAPSFNKQKGFEISDYLASADRELVHYYLVPSPEDYARLFERSGEQRVVGECSTYYLSSKVAPKNIYGYNPNAKIVVLLRNPLHRIRSHYTMDRSLGTTARPLLSLIEDELALGKEANWGNCRFYLGASRYLQQLDEYYRYFASENICVLSFEQLIADPERQLRRLFGFLGIAPPLGPITLPRVNKSRAARFPALNSCLRASGLRPLVAEVLKRTLPNRLKQEVRSVYYRDGVRVVTDDELVALGDLLRDEGLESEWLIAAGRIPSFDVVSETVSCEGNIAA